MEAMVQTGLGVIALSASLDIRPERFTEICGMAQVSYHVYHQEPNIGLVKAYHQLWQAHKSEYIQVYIHDDVSIHDANWLERVCCEMMEPSVAIVGLGGATGIGDPDLYKTPYMLKQLARTGYASNQSDWEVHGDREEDERKVAVVDGFFMAVRGTFLNEVGGWSWIQSNFHCYDLALCLEAYRRGWEVRTVGVACTHHGGGTSTTRAYAQWCKDQGTTMEDEHRNPHRWLYEEYRDLLPMKVAP